MICPDCRQRDHDLCRGGTWCDCAHRESRRITEEINSDPEEVAKLRAAREQARMGQFTRLHTEEEVPR